MRDFGYASPATVRPSGSYEMLPRLAVLSTARDEPGDWLRAGQALQRVLLTATRHGVATSLLYQPIELHDMRQSDDAGGPGRNARRSSCVSATGRRSGAAAASIANPVLPAGRGRRDSGGPVPRSAESPGRGQRHQPTSWIPVRSWGLMTMT